MADKKTPPLAASNWGISPLVNAKLSFSRTMLHDHVFDYPAHWSNEKAKPDLHDYAHALRHGLVVHALMQPVLHISNSYTNFIEDGLTEVYKRGYRQTTEQATEQLASEKEALTRLVQQLRHPSIKRNTPPTLDRVLSDSGLGISTLKYPAVIPVAREIIFDMVVRAYPDYREKKESTAMQHGLMLQKHMLTNVLGTEYGLHGIQARNEAESIYKGIQDTVAFHYPSYAEKQQAGMQR